MAKIETLSVTVEPSGETPRNLSNCTASEIPTGNLIPLLHEIRHALDSWLHQGHTHTIDLQGLPMSPDEERQLKTLLGEGEVHAGLSALGKSVVMETAYAGVWRITHYNDDELPIGHFIEVCSVPELLKSHPEDAHRSLQDLDDLLNNAETMA